MKPVLKFFLFFFLIITWGTGIVLAKDRVAVLDFESIPPNQNLARSVSEILRTELVNLKNYEVVERASLQKILTEQKLQLSDALDEKNAVRVGKLAGTQVVVIGSIVKIGQTYTLNSRFIDVETGIAREGKSLRCENENNISSLCHQLVLAFTGQANPEEKKPEETKKPPVPDEPGFIILRVQDENNENCPEITVKLGDDQGFNYYKKIPGDFLGNAYGYDRHKFSFEEKISVPSGSRRLKIHIPDQGFLCRGIKDQILNLTLGPGEAKVLRVFFRNLLVSKGWQAELEK